MDENFNPMAAVTVKLINPPRNLSTDTAGVFTFTDLKPGDYTIRVTSSGFNAVEVQNIHVAEGEDHRLRRILLEAGAIAGNCTVRIQPARAFVHTRGKDVAISGRVQVGRREKAAVTLIVFTENERVTHSTISDDQGRFSFVVPTAGDVRLKVATRNRSGEQLIPEQQVDLGWVELGDRVSIPKIKLSHAGLGGFCY